MKLATYNVENMFERAKAMNYSDWPGAKPILEDFAHLNELIEEPQYTVQVKDELLTIMKRHKGLTTQGESTYMVLRENHGKLVKKSKTKPVIVASGRSSWIGWFELKKEPVEATATENIARIIDSIGADVQCLVEAETRIGLVRFDQNVLRKVGTTLYQHVMLVQGNDTREINIGIMTKKGFDIVRMLSHVDDYDGNGLIFSRDCAEYEIKTALGNTLLLLVNHFKSKGFGDPVESAAKRLRQAKRVREIYDQYIHGGYDYIAVVGDLNENPNEPPMVPLLRNGSDLCDIMSHPRFVGDGRLGTHGDGTPSEKLDYILMSPKLSAKVLSGGIERRGVWGGTKGTLFPHLETIKTYIDSASDHAALWVELDI